MMRFMQYQQIVDYAISLVKLVQNHKVGWLTLNKKTGEYEREQQPLVKKSLNSSFSSIPHAVDQPSTSSAAIDPPQDNCRC